MLKKSLCCLIVLLMPIVCRAASPPNKDTNFDGFWNSDERILNELQSLDARKVDELVSRFDQWIKTQDSEPLLKLPEEFSPISRWFTTRTKEQEQIASLQVTIRTAEALLKQKQLALTNVQQKIALLKLNPQQLAEVEQYNQSLKHEPSSAMEWLKTRSTQYDISKDILLTLLGVPAGMVAEYVRRKWVQKRRVPTTME